MMLTIAGQGSVTLTPSATGPEKPEGGDNPDTEFVICMISDKYALLRPILPVGGQRKPTFLAANLQGSIKIDTSGSITPGCIWQI